MDYVGPYRLKAEFQTRFHPFRASHRDMFNADVDTDYSLCRMPRSQELCRW
jgi:hypothetical protein